LPSIGGLKSATLSGLRFFVEIGKYLKRPSTYQPLEVVDAPHVPKEFPVTLSAASASSVRRGGKLDRAVLLNDIAKIARLALKFPLSFVDSPACAFALFLAWRRAQRATAPGPPQRQMRRGGTYCKRSGRQHVAHV